MSASGAAAMTSCSFRATTISALSPAATRIFSIATESISCIVKLVITKIFILSNQFAIDFRPFFGILFIYAN